MDVKVSDKAKDKLKSSLTKNYRIDVVSNGWAGPVFGLVQGEPKEEDIIIRVDDINFAVEDYFQDVIKSFDVDYYDGIFRRGFVIYPNGQRSSC